jgi:hypothetical protein
MQGSTTKGKAMDTEHLTAPLQADALRRGDLILCGTKFREVLVVDVRAENDAGEATEFYVTVGGKDRSRRLTLCADLTVTIRDRKWDLTTR